MTITLELMVDDLPSALRFYQQYLGFSIETLVPKNEPFFARLARDEAKLMLYHRREFSQELSELATAPLGGSFVLYLEVDDIVSLYQTLPSVTQIVQPLHHTEYGTQEFTCLDPSGYRLMFAQKGNTE